MVKCDSVEVEFVNIFQNPVVSISFTEFICSAALKRVLQNFVKI
jgi:hypothetical protein